MKRTLAALLAVLMTMLLWVEPARAADQPLEVSLKTPIEKITTRHIQELELSVKNSENQPRKVRLVMALVDYKGNVFSRAVSELTLKEKGSDAVKEHLKILPKAYEVRVFAEDTAGKILFRHGADNPVSLLTLPEENKSGYAPDAQAGGVGLLAGGIHLVDHNPSGEAAGQGIQHRGQHLAGPAGG